MNKDFPVIFTTHSPKETFDLGENLGKFLSQKTLTECFVILLEGNLGAGKTCFTKGLAAGLGIEDDEVSSPTFALINEYKGISHKLYHLDLYRLLEETDFNNTLGLDEMLSEPAIVVIEWGERLKNSIFDFGTRIILKILNDEEREITLQILGFTDKDPQILNFLKNLRLK